MAFIKQSEPKPTWRAIVAALRNPVVNLPQLAMRLEVKHCPDSTATHATPLKTTQLSHISEIARGPQCQSRISDAAVAHNGMTYFADIYEFDVSRRYWTRMIQCQQTYFGMAIGEDELTLIGGLIKSKESEDLEVATMHLGQFLQLLQLNNSYGIRSIQHWVLHDYIHKLLLLASI